MREQKIRDAVHTGTMDAEMKFEQLAEQVGAFHSRVGRWPSMKSGDAAERELSEWLNTQRTHSRSGALRPDRRSSLDEVAPGWMGQGLDETWNENACKVGAFHSRVGRWPSRKSGDATEKALGEWLRKQRAQSRSGTLRPDRRAYLDEVSAGWMNMDLDETWDENARKVGVFHSREGRWPSRRLDDATGDGIGRWLSTQRAHARSGTLRTDRRFRLDEVASGWMGQAPDETWEENARKAGAFHVQEGRWPSTESDDSSEKKLGRWLRNQRAHARNGAFRAGRRAYLDEVAAGWMGQDREGKWNEIARKVGAFHREVGRWPSRKSGDATEKGLGEWLNNQRAHSRSGTLRAGRGDYLDEVAPGWMSQGSDERWSERARDLGAFYAREGKWTEKGARDIALKRHGQWLRHQRIYARNGTLRADRRAYLDEHLPGWLPDV